MKGLDAVKAFMQVPGQYAELTNLYININENSKILNT